MTDAALPGRRPDAPRTAYRVLERRATVGTCALLLALSGVAWWSTVRGAHAMRDMTQGFAHTGDAMPFDLAAPVFLAMWLTMMVAMMLPTVAPVVLLHRLVLRRRGEGARSTVVFVAGYLAVWTAVGVVPLAVLVAFRQVAHGSPWVDRAGGAVLVVAGAYQFTRWKDACARACRSPLTFLATHDFGRGARGAFRAGAAHGLFCLGCCWGLMAVLLVVGLMNLVWMALIAAVFLAEKHWDHGLGLARAAGTAVLVLGVAVLAHPSVLDALTPAPPASTTSTGPMG